MFERSPFLRSAVDFIARNPGCCKAEIIRNYRGGKIPARTYSYYNSRLNELLICAHVKGAHVKGRYYFEMRAPQTGGAK